MNEPLPKSLSRGAWVASWRRSRLVKGVGANLLSQIASTTMQFLSVPIYLLHWGASAYGTWIVLFTLPSYVALFDLGFTTAAGNDMTLAAAAGRHADADRTFRSLWSGILGLSVAGCVLVGLIVALLPDAVLPGAGLMSGTQIRLTILLLSVYAFASLNASVVLVGFRAARLYPRGTIFLSIVAVAESAASLGVVLAGGGLLASAIAFVTVRVVAVPVMYALLRAKAGWLGPPTAQVDFGRLKRLLPVSIATMALPLGFAITLQGTVLALAVSLPPAMIVVYTSVRTLTRVAFQLTATVSNGVTPEFTVMVGQNRMDQAANLFAINFFAAVLILTPAVLVLWLAGPEVVRLWTAGAIDAPRGLIVGLALATAFHGLWHFLVSLLRATNRYSVHDAYLYPLAALAACVLVGVLARTMGVIAAVYPTLVLEMLMFVIVIRQCSRYEEFRWAALATAVKNIPDRLYRSGRP